MDVLLRSSASFNRGPFCFEGHQPTSPFRHTVISHKRVTWFSLHTKAKIMRVQKQKSSWEKNAFAFLWAGGRRIVLNSELENRRNWSCNSTGHINGKIRLEYTYWTRASLWCHFLSSHFMSGGSGPIDLQNIAATEICPQPKPQLPLCLFRCTFL